MLALFVLLLSSNVIQAAEVTVAGLKERGLTPLDNAAIRQLIVDKIIIVRNLETLSYYEVRFNKDGTRVLQGVAATKVGGGLEYIPFTADPQTHTAQYEIKGGKLITRFDDRHFEVIIFKVGNTHYAAHSADGGAVKWELVRQ